MKFKTYLFKSKSESLPSSNPFLLISDKVLNFPFPPPRPMVECPLPYDLPTASEIRE